MHLDTLCLALVLSPVWALALFLVNSTTTRKPASTHLTQGERACKPPACSEPLTTEHLSLSLSVDGAPIHLFGALSLPQASSWLPSHHKLLLRL